MKHKIGLEASSLLAHRLSGIQRYILELSCALSSLIGSDSELGIELCYKVSRIRKASLRPALKLKHRWYWPFPGFSIRGYDLVHALDTTLPWPLPRKLICTVHDLFSIVVKDYSKEHYRKNKIRSYQHIAQTCNAIIVPSKTTKQDLLNNLNYPENQVFVVPHGVNPIFYQKTDPTHRPEKKRVIGKPYVIAFGGRERKNLPRIVKAVLYSGLAESHLLAVIGKIEPEALAVIKDNGLENRVLSLGNVNDADLAELYREASILCFPSLYEGFGLPVLEAMATGIPVVTSSIGATADVGLNHAILVNPKSVAEISDGMRKAIMVGREQLQKAKEYAQGFTWEKTAIETLAIYKSILHI